MTLIKCAECGKSISDKATVCPNCGVPIIAKKYCTECGKEISDKATSCPNCGCPVEYDNRVTNNNISNTIDRSEQYNVMGISGFVTSMVSLLLNFWGIVGIVAVILSTVGLTQIRNTNEKGKGLAITGIVVGSISVVYGFITLMLLATQ